MDAKAGHINLDCGIAYGRLADWLGEELGLRREADGWLLEIPGSSCTVALERLEPRRLGGLELERCRFMAEGDGAAVDQLERLFTLRFMSAGG